MLNACEDSLTFKFSTDFKVKMNIDVEDTGKSDVFPFANTEILDIEEDEGHKRKEAVDPGDSQREDRGADRPDTREGEKGKDPASAVEAVEEVAADDVQEACKEEGAVEKPCRRADHAEVADRVRVDAVPGCHGRADH